jgi:hypothetical protein
MNNNADQNRDVSVSLNGAAISDRIGGEQSTPTAYWQALDPIESSDPASFSVSLPPISVTTLTWPFS